MCIVGLILVIYQRQQYEQWKSTVIDITHITVDAGVQIDSNETKQYYTCSVFSPRLLFFVYFMLPSSGLKTTPTEIEL